MKKNILIQLLIGLAAPLALQAQSFVMADYEIPVAEPRLPLAPIYQAPSVTGRSMSLGSGVTYLFSGSTIIQSTGWTTTSLANARAGNDYLEFGINSAPAGTTLSSATLVFRRDATGPTSYSLEVSQGGGSFTQLTTGTVPSATTSTSFSLGSFNINTFAAVLRLYAWGGSAGGKMIMENAFGSERGDLVLRVEGQAIPEPHAYALVAGLGLVGFGLWRRLRG